MSYAVWCVLPSAAPHWRSWDQQTVVYDAANATTHLLTEAHGEIFGLLATAPGAAMTESGLLTACGADDATAAEIAALRDILDSLRTLGLTECRAL